MDNIDIEQYKKLFSERLRSLRIEKGFKQEYLAEKLNISTTVMSRLENASTVPKFDTLIQLSDIFNVSIDYLLGRSDNRNIRKPTFQQKSEQQKTAGKNTVSNEAVKSIRTKTLRERTAEMVTGLSTFLVRDFE